MIVYSSAFCQADEAKKKFDVPKNYSPGKICLLVADVGTIDTVAKTEEFLTQIKQFNTDDAPKLSDADRTANPRLAQKEINIRFNDNIRRYSDREREIARRNRRMERVLEQLRNSIVGNAANRDIVVAKNYLHSYLQPYSEFISVIDRANSSLAEVEKAIGGNDQQDVASACVFLTVIMQDLQEESNTVQVGNTMVKKTVYTRKAVANVRDFNGNVLFSTNVAAKSSFRKTSASKNTGHNPASDMMESILKQVADRVGNFFTTKLRVSARGPKGDEDFDENNVVLYLDGNEFENGSITVTGVHQLRVECDGYRAIIREINLKPGQPRTIRLTLKKNKPQAAPSGSENAD